MMNILEYDDIKLAEDEREIGDIANNIKKEAFNLNKEIKKATLMRLIDDQDKIMDSLSSDYDKLLNVCNELLHITRCIEESRKSYSRCEEKISDLLDRIKVS